jgi:hypothetical protein
MDSTLGWPDSVSIAADIFLRSGMAALGVQWSLRAKITLDALSEGRDKSACELRLATSKWSRHGARGLPRDPGSRGTLPAWLNRPCSQRAGSMLKICRPLLKTRATSGRRMRYVPWLALEPSLTSVEVSYIVLDLGTQLPKDALAGQNRIQLAVRSSAT